MIRPDGSPVSNTIVIVTSTTQPGSKAISSTHTSDNDGYVIFHRDIGEDVTRLNINVCMMTLSANRRLSECSHSESPLLQH